MVVVILLGVVVIVVVASVSYYFSSCYSYPRIIIHKICYVRSLCFMRARFGVGGSE